MATITLRQQKGSPLTNQEIDDNFSNLNSNKLELSGGTLTGDLSVPQLTSSYSSGDTGGTLLLNKPSSNTTIDTSVSIKLYQNKLQFSETGGTYRGAWLDITGSANDIGSLILTSTNYNSYSPTLGGIGATGTWPISITGNSATVTSITSSQVTSALGYTPYNSSNPNSYISANQTISISGDASGSGTTSILLTLANSGVTASTYGSSTNIPQITVNSKGLITSVSNVAVSIPSGSLTFTGDVTGTGTTGSSTTLTLANSGVTAGTYTKITVDAKGRVTSGTTLASADLPTYTGTITSSQVTTALGYTPIRTRFTINDNIDSDWGEGFVTFDPIPSGTPPASNPNIRVINVGNDYNRRTQMAFIYSADQAWFRRRTEAGWGSWREFWHSGNLTNLNQLTNGPGYITGYTETDTLASVTARGASTSSAVTLSSMGNQFGGHFYLSAYDAAGNHYPHFNDGANSSGAKVNWRLYTGATNSVTHSWTTLYTYFGTRVESVGDVRATVYYDQPDTAYYLDPASTTTSGVFNGNLQITPRSASWAEGLQFYMPSTGTWGGIRWVRNTSNYYGSWYMGWTALDSSNDIVFGTNVSGTQIDNIFRLYHGTAGSAKIGRDLYISGLVSGNYGNRLIVGATDTSYTLQDTNLRPTIQAHGQYPVLSLNHTVTSNINHGPTIQFTCNGTGNQFVIGTNGTGTMLSMGYSSASDWNPHNGISGYNGTSFFQAATNGYIGIGAEGDWTVSGGTGTHTPAYHLHFIGSNNAANGHAAFFDNRVNAANNGSGFLFRNLYGNHSWGVVAEIRAEGTSGTDRPSLLFSTGYNSDTWSVGFGYYGDSNFRIKYDHGHRNGGWGTTAVEVDRSSNMWAYGSMRSPIFYDSNDTAYYLDPNGISKLYSIQAENLGGAVLNRVTSNIGVATGYRESIAFIDGSQVQAHVSTKDGTGGCYQWYTTEWVWVDPEKDYEFSFWVRSDGTANIYFGWHELNGSGNGISANPYFSGAAINTNGTWVKRVALLRNWRTPSGYSDTEGTDRYTSANSRNTTWDCTDGVMHSTTRRVHLRFGTCYGGTSAGQKTYFHLASIREVTGHDRQAYALTLPYYNGGFQGSMNLRTMTHWDNISGIDLIGGSGEFRMSSDSGSLNLRVDGTIRSEDVIYGSVFYDHNTSYYLDANTTGTSLNVAGNIIFGNGGSDTGALLYYGGGSGDYGRIRFYQAGNNNQTIHIFSTAWQGGTLQSSAAGSINISGANGVTLGGWNVITSTGHWFDNSGNGQSSGSFRSPIFYDTDTTYYLDLNGTSNASTTMLGAWYFRSNRNTDSNSPPLQVYSNDGGGAIMSFHRGGYYAVNFGLDSDNVIRIGGWSASTNRWQLDMSGNGTFAGNVTAYSDIRLKENIQTITNALSKVRSIRGVTFTRNDQEDKLKLHLGVIAQEVEQILPEIISQDNDGIKNVAYGNMVALLIEAIKEQQQQFDKQQQELQELKNLVKELLTQSR